LLIETPLSTHYKPVQLLLVPPSSRRLVSRCLARAWRCTRALSWTTQPRSAAADLEIEPSSLIADEITSR